MAMVGKFNGYDWRGPHGCGPGHRCARCRNRGRWAWLGRWLDNRLWPGGHGLVGVRCEK